MSLITSFRVCIGCFWCYFTQSNVHWTAIDVTDVIVVVDNARAHEKAPSFKQNAPQIMALYLSMREAWDQSPFIQYNSTKRSLLLITRNGVCYDHCADSYSYLFVLVEIKGSLHYLIIGEM